MSDENKTRTREALQLEASKLNDQPKAEEVPQQEEKQVVNG